MPRTSASSSRSSSRRVGGLGRARLRRRDPAGLAGKAKQAFTSAFLGTTSFRWSTFVAVAEITQEQFEAVIDALASHFVERYGAPSPKAAHPAARAEAEFAASLCAHPINTLLAVERAFGPDGIIEPFRIITRHGSPAHTKIWTIGPDGEVEGATVAIGPFLETLGPQPRAGRSQPEQVPAWTAR